MSFLFPPLLLFFFYFSNTQFQSININIKITNSHPTQKSSSHGITQIHNLGCLPMGRVPSHTNPSPTFNRGFHDNVDEALSSKVG